MCIRDRYNTVYVIDNSQKHKRGFGKSTVLPFFSGVVGCALVIGTCFGIPSVRDLSLIHI